MFSLGKAQNYAMECFFFSLLVNGNSFIHSFISTLLHTQFVLNLFQGHNFCFFGGIFSVQPVPLTQRRFVLWQFRSSIRQGRGTHICTSLTVGPFVNLRGLRPGSHICPLFMFSSIWCTLLHGQPKLTLFQAPLARAHYQRQPACTAVVSALK